MELEDFNRIREYMRQCYDDLPTSIQRQDWGYYMSNNTLMVQNQSTITKTIKKILDIDLGPVPWKEPVDRLGLNRISKHQKRVLY
jgi:hypothetical protein